MMIFVGLWAIMLGIVAIAIGTAEQDPNEQHERKAQNDD